MTKKTQLILVGIILILGMTIYATYDVLTEEEDREITKYEEDKEDVNIINDEIINKSKEEIDDFPSVLDSYIEKEGERINFYVVVDRGLSNTEIKELGEDIIRRFASITSIEKRDRIEGPGRDSLGEVWDFYSGNIYVGYDEEPFIHGVIQPTRDNIRWFEI